MFRFPRYVGTKRYPRAVLRVINAGSSDELSPGGAPFSWGADFRLDQRNQGAGVDNGNNLIARGLFDEPTLYKAEVDGGRPACTVKGDDGVLTVRLRRPVKTDAWYRLSCDRNGDYLTIRTWRIGVAGLRAPSSEVRTGPMGRVDMASPAIPVSIGGKLAPDGRMILSATDQFNGSITNAFLNIQGTSSTDG